ncbi:MAG: serine/threonine protein kinase [Myxococcales bacterium]|nr:serine/threonine protein kinase [Myxococcales bacterium]
MVRPERARPLAVESSANKLEPGATVVGRYRILRQLGVGGMGSVYLVQDLKTDERFALKVLHETVVSSAGTLERFRREARTPARIDSDHVARVTDTDVATDLGGVPFLVMEYLRGSNLQEVSEELGALPAEEVLVYLRQAAIALDKAHAIGIVHRDLKPENLFLTTRDDGTPCIKVLDFGIAKLSGATGDLASYKATHTGDVFGTPLFMSPEQCKGEIDRICPQTDVWALGLIAYRLLTGKDFWTAATLTHLIAQIAYEPMPVASTRGVDLGPTFDAWFAKCCARDIAERFTGAGEAVRELGRALGVPEPTRSQDHLRVSNLRAAAMARVDVGESLPLKSTAQALTLSHVAATRGRRRRVGWLVMAGVFVAGGAAVAIALTATGPGAPAAATNEAAPAGRGSTTPSAPVAAPSPAASSTAPLDASATASSSTSAASAEPSASGALVASAAPTATAARTAPFTTTAPPPTTTTPRPSATAPKPPPSSPATATATATVTNDPLGSRH